MPPLWGTAINCALIVAMASLLISVGFWTAGVSQLGNWRGLFPAITLVAGLFAFVSTLVLSPATGERARREVPCSRGALLFTAIGDRDWTVGQFRDVIFTPLREPAGQLSHHRVE